MIRRKRRRYTDEQRAEAVRLVHRLGNLSEAARRLDISAGTLHGWVMAVDGDEEIPEATTPEGEKEELRRLRKEVKTLRMERDFLKKATVHSIGQRNIFSSNSEKRGWCKWLQGDDQDSPLRRERICGTDGRTDSR